MSYFSLVQLQRKSPDVQRQLRDLSRHGDAYRDHCLIWKLFPEDGYDRDFVFRRRQQPGDLTYYVVSDRLPQPMQKLFTVQTKPYEPKLTEGEWLRFELQANPTVSHKCGDTQSTGRRRSRRHDVLMDAKHSCKAAADSVSGVNDAVEAAALTWLLEQSAKWGLHVDQGSVLTNAYTQHRLKASGREIQFSSLDYCGVARVTDSVLLTSALLRGVGHSRGFGCGLLLVRRAE